MFDKIIETYNQCAEMYRTLTYHRKHCHRINWDGTMSDSAQFRAACVAGLMIGAALFCAFLM